MLSWEEARYKFTQRNEGLNASKAWKAVPQGQLRESQWEKAGGEPERRWKGSEVQKKEQVS